jgi:hypothetical protein
MNHVGVNIVPPRKLRNARVAPRGSRDWSEALTIKISTLAGALCFKPIKPEIRPPERTSNAQTNTASGVG